MTEFAKWAAGMDNNVHPADIGLFQRAQIVRAFSGAYTLETARQASVEALWALELLDAAAKIAAPQG